MTNKEKQRKKRIAASQNAGGAMFNLMHGKSANNPIAQTFSNSTKEAKDYEPKSSSKTSKAKAKSKTSSIKRNKNGKPKKDNQKLNKSNESPDKSKGSKKAQLNKLKKSAVGLFHGKKPTKPIKYGNIRVKQHVVDDLHSLQEITNYRSRSDLLDQMIALTKKLVLTSPKLKKEYKNNIKHYKTIRDVK